MTVRCCVICLSPHGCVLSGTPLFPGCRCRDNRFHPTCLVAYVQSLPHWTLATCPVCRRTSGGVLVSWVRGAQTVVTHGALLLGVCTLSVHSMLLRTQDTTCLRATAWTLASTCALQHPALQRWPPRVRTLLWVGQLLGLAWGWWTWAVCLHQQQRLNR